MVNKLKKIVGPLFLAVICGAVSGRLVYSIYMENNDFSNLSDIIYLIQVGAYSSYDNMKANTLSNNYVYYEDDGFRVSLKHKRRVKMMLILIFIVFSSHMQKTYFRLKHINLFV